MRYVRVGWRKIAPGDVLKDPRGDRRVNLVNRWGYRLERDAAHPYEFLRNWPKVGRLKVVQSDLDGP